MRDNYEQLFYAEMEFSGVEKIFYGITMITRAPETLSWET